MDNTKFMDAIEQRILARTADRRDQDEKPIWQRVRELADGFASLEHALGAVRATLLVNFGEGSNQRFGFTVAERPSTVSMMVEAFAMMAAQIDAANQSGRYLIEIFEKSDQGDVFRGLVLSPAGGKIGPADVRPKLEELLARWREETAGQTAFEFLEFLGKHGFPPALGPSIKFVINDETGH